MTEAKAPYQTVERVQTGIRLEKRLLKVLKALAEYKDMTLGDLIEGIALHALEGKTPFSDPTLAHIRDLKRIYELTLRASDSHRLAEGRARTRSRP
jgi:hypothetical protein